MSLSLRSALVAAVLTVAAACSTDRAAPSAPALFSPKEASTGTTSTLTTSQAAQGTVIAVKRKQPLRQNISSSAVIGPAGGSIEIANAGVQINFSSGAIAVPTTITVTALAGNMLAYEFQPHGIQFSQEVKIKQDMKPTNWYDQYDKSKLEAAYFKDATQLDQAAGTAVVDEFLPLSVDVSKSKVEFRVTHFSGYIVAMGRK